MSEGFCNCISPGNIRMRSRPHSSSRIWSWGSTGWNKDKTCMVWSSQIWKEYVWNWRILTFSGQWHKERSIKLSSRNSWVSNRFWRRKQNALLCLLWPYLPAKTWSMNPSCTWATSVERRSNTWAHREFKSTWIMRSSWTCLRTWLTSG